MEAARKKVIMLAVILIAGSVITVGAKKGWFGFILEPILETPDISRREPFTLSNIPAWLESNVTITGTGYIGEEHGVELEIWHTRPDNGGYWEAAGSYTLGLEESDGTLIEVIESDDFTDLRASPNIFSETLTWMPSAPPAEYFVALSIYDIVWVEIIDYTITASAGTGGSITDPGENSVLEGDSQGFTITPDTDYGIADVLVDSESVGPVSVYLFENVQADHTIHAIFELGETYMSNAVQTAYAGAPVWWDLTILDSPRYEEIYNTYTYMPGDTIELSFKFHITGEIPSGTRCTSYTYSIVIERVGGGDAFTAVPSTTETGDWGLGAWMVHYHNITAPGFGEWFATVHVTNITWTPP